MTSLAVADLTLAYDPARPVVSGLDLEIPSERVTAIVGANACGKSTLLRGLARLLRPRGGAVLLDGAAVDRMSTRDVARRIGLLPQSPSAPEGLTVEDLVARGRYPHQSLLQQWSAEDSEKVEWALRVTHTDVLRARSLDSLSGGQRQRAWIALALAQDTGVLLLDEPTTYLDLAHQVEVLDLVTDLNEHQGRTVVMVLHDLNQAARWAHHVVAMRGGRVWAQGAPADVVDAELLREVYGLEGRVIPDPETGTPLCVPLARPARDAVEAGAPPVPVGLEKRPA